MVYRIRVYFFSIEKSGSMMFTFKSMKNPSRFAPRFLVVTTFLSALVATDVMAQTKSDYLAGKELFTRHWQYEPPLALVRRAGITDKQFVKQLEKLAGDGLGPMHNATSCEACHAAGGGAGVDRNVTLLTLDPRSPIIKRALRNRGRSEANIKSRTSIATQIDKLFPAFIADNGRISLDVVVHEASTRPGYKSIRQQLADGVTGGIDAQWFDRNQRTSQAIAQTPVIAGRKGEMDYYLSQRNSPPLFGLGLIDQIKTKQLESLAMSQKKKSGGVITGRLGRGKFGWRAQTPTLAAFVAGACAGELGLRVEAPAFQTGFPTSVVAQPADFADDSYVSLGTDINPRQFGQLVSFVRQLPAPHQKSDTGYGLPNWSTADARKGKQLFNAVGCAACHVENVLPARGLFSDMLLHDMGPHLQAPSPSSALVSSTMPLPIFPRDNRSFGSGPSIAAYYGGGTTPRPYNAHRPLHAQFPYVRIPEAKLNSKAEENDLWDTLQREWRTPPLWGVADSAPYLHDGRATTLDSAIRWHAGEASKSAEKYRSLDAKNQKFILSFLKSLRAPVDAKPTPSSQSDEAKWFEDQMIGADSDEKTKPKQLVGRFE